MPFDDVVSAIGHTPVVELARFSPNPEVHIFAKLEGCNPTGSIKDRVAKYMIEQAELNGELTSGKIILEPTSGNTGIGLAMIGHRKGYRVKVVMPDNAGPERRQLLELFGAEVVLSEGARGTNGTIEVARELANDPAYFMPFQYGNPANPLAHYETTAPEIIADLPDLNVFVAGMGTGGTLMGVGRRLKEHNPAIKIIAVEPHPGEQVQGLRSLAEGFIPPIVDLSLLDGKYVVRSWEAVQATRELTAREGIFAGASSGAVLNCAIRVAQRMKSGNILCLFADGGWKYLSTGLWTKSVQELRGEVDRHLWW